MSNNIKPFLKWAGGKTQLIEIIKENMPDINTKDYLYVEPFIGAGAVFFDFINNKMFKKYIINDINSKLINLYIMIRDNCDELIETLNNLKIEYNNLESIDEKSVMYYRVREDFNDINISNILQASYFIFLNKTCFNGLYRENSKGGFNVPFGKHKSPSIFDEQQIRDISNTLKLKDKHGENIVVIKNVSYSELINEIDNNTFVYMDPPYRPVTEGGFNSYNKSSFNDEEQTKLSYFYKKLNDIKAYLMLSNSDPKNLDANDNFFDELYEEFNIQRISANRMINSDSSGRGMITELLITNYENKYSTNKLKESDEVNVNMVCSFNYLKDEKTFRYLLDTLQDSIKGFDYFVNWDKVYGNVRDIEIELNMLNYLVGKENIEEEAKYLLQKHPQIIKVIPILVACRDKVVNICDIEDNLKISNSLFDFQNFDNINIDDIVKFMRESGILGLLSSKKIKNIVDYVFGVEVGLDSNGRKNRSGTSMENLVERFVKQFCINNSFRYITQATPKKIKQMWGYDVSVDKTARRFDLAINTGSKLYLIETNYYGGGGSKLKATAGEYKTLFDITKNDGHEFIWITDGKGWLTAHLPLEEAFYHNNYIINIEMLTRNILEDIIK